MKKITIMALLACVITLLVSQQAMAARPHVGDTITNTATATYNDAASVAMTPVSASVNVTVTQVYSVTVALAQNTKSGTANGTVSYTAVITNTGNGTDTFNLTNAHQASGWSPTSVTFYSDAGLTTTITATNALGPDNGTQTVYAKVVIPGSATDGQQSVDRFTATSQGLGTVSAYDTGTTTVGVADLSTSTNAASASPVKANDSVTYTVHLHNTGTYDASNVVAKETIPAGVTYVSSSEGAWDAPTKTLTVNYGALAMGGTHDITLTVTVNGGQTDLTVLTANAKVDYDTGTNVMTQVSKDAAMTVHAPRLTVTKVSDKATAAPGDTIHYTVTVTNSGNDVATSVVLVDTLSTYITNVRNLSVTGGTGSYDGAANKITVNPTGNTLGVGATMTIVYDVDVKTS
jgi:uncharacterized repeat protein (TIGR01451 family)